MKLYMLSVRQSPYISAFYIIVAVVALGMMSPFVVRADDLENEPIFYSKSEPKNVVAELQQRLIAGTTKLEYHESFGYLRSLLRELKTPESSQMLVYSKTSLQQSRISPRSPRAIYFNDDVYIGYCKSSPVLEISAVDPKLGAVFYTLEKDHSKPRILRQVDRCILCHASSQTHGIPGHLVRSVFVGSDGFPLLGSGTFRTNHTSPLEQRWGGWYVTGTHGDQMHLGNMIVRSRYVPRPVKNPDGLNVTKLNERVRWPTYYPTQHSDIVALMVFEHQTEGQNLITHAAFQTRIALHTEAALNREFKESRDHRWKTTTVRIKAAAEPLVKYLLFHREAKLTAQIRGTSTFADDFQKLGIRDKKGRSLRELDIKTRLFKYPCSYLIYSPSFDAIPAPAKEYIYERMWDILTGLDSSAEFDHLTRSDRQAILEILLATKRDLPEYWRKK